MKYIDPDGRQTVPRSYWQKFTLKTMFDLVATNGVTKCNEFVPRFLKGLGDKVFNDIMPSGSPDANTLYSSWTQNPNLVNLNELVGDAGNVQERAAYVANSYANQGYLVLAAASDGGGHVAVVAPQVLNFDCDPSVNGFTGSGQDGHQGRSGPVVLRDFPVFLQAGTHTGRVPPGWAFSRELFDAGRVIFFLYKPTEGE